MCPGLDSAHANAVHDKVRVFDRILLRCSLTNSEGATFLCDDGASEFDHDADTLSVWVKQHKFLDT